MMGTFSLGNSRFSFFSCFFSGDDHLEIGGTHWLALELGVSAGMELSVQGRSWVLYTAGRTFDERRGVSFVWKVGNKYILNDALGWGRWNYKRYWMRTVTARSV